MHKGDMDEDISSILATEEMICSKEDKTISPQSQGNSFMGWCLTSQLKCKGTIRGRQGLAALVDMIVQGH